MLNVFLVKKKNSCEEVNIGKEDTDKNEEDIDSTEEFNNAEKEKINNNEENSDNKENEKKIDDEIVENICFYNNINILLFCLLCLCLLF